MFNTNDRLVYHSNALLNTHVKDEQGLPIVRQAMTQEQAITAAMEALSHPVLWMWPDVILFISAFFMTAPWFHMLRNRRIKTVILHTEEPYQTEEELERGSLADANLLNDPTNLHRFRAIGPAEYFPHCYRPSVHYPRQGPRDPGKASDFCFIGTAFKSRIGFFEQMNLDGIDALIAGADWGATPEGSPLVKHIATGIGTDQDCVDNTETAEIYRHSKMGINFYRRESEAEWDGKAYAMGPREVELAACGLPFLRDPRAEGDEVLPMLPTFSSPGEAGEKLRWYLAHEREREEMAARARAAIADRTFENSARRFLRLVEGL